MSSTLEIRALHVALASSPDKPIVKGLDLTIRLERVVFALELLELSHSLLDLILKLGRDAPWIQL